MEKDARASRKQRELLLFIDGFIKGNGYGPSYREVMRALGYKSVSTVASHIDGLIIKGYLKKRDHSARSIEVVSLDSSEPSKSKHLQWLASEIEGRPEGEDRSLLERAYAILEVGLKQS